MPTLQQTQSSLSNFNAHLSELLSEGVVSFYTREQVNFFLKFLSMFHALDEVRAWHFEGVHVEPEPDYENNRMVTVEVGSGEGWLVSFGEVTDEAVQQIVSFDYCRHHEISITNGQIA